jgi:hypothetical protein
MANLLRAYLRAMQILSYEQQVWGSPTTLTARRVFRVLDARKQAQVAKPVPGEGASILAAFLASY